jgi:hypothetical protein
MTTFREILEQANLDCPPGDAAQWKRERLDQVWVECAAVGSCGCGEPGRGMPIRPCSSMLSRVDRDWAAHCEQRRRDAFALARQRWLVKLKTHENNAATR